MTTRSTPRLALCLAVVLVAACGPALASNARDRRAVREQLQSMVDMAAVEDIPDDLKERLAGIHRELRQLNANGAPDVPAMVRVSHRAAEVRLGEGDDYVSFARSDDVPDGIGEVGPALNMHHNAIFDGNVTVGGNLFLNGRTIIEGIDLWHFVQDLLSENNAQDAQIAEQSVQIATLQHVVSELNASIVALGGKVGGADFGATASNPAKSCFDALHRGGQKTSGIYWINFYDSQAAAQAVYCEMTFKGGGWTLLTAQDDDSYFDTSASSNKYWMAANVGAPNPLSELYSILGKVDKLRGPSQNWDAQYVFEDTIDRNSFLTDQCVRTRQSDSILKDWGSANYGGDFARIDFCKSAASQYLTGYARSKTAQCAVDGHIHNWQFCAAQLSYYSTNCGLVSGSYADRSYCPTTRHSFWIREVPQ